MFRLKHKKINPEVNTVFLKGSFNKWGKGYPMVYNKRKKIWSVTITVKPGSYRYKFNWGGRNWIADPANNNIEMTGHGNSIVIVK